MFAHDLIGEIVCDFDARIAQMPHQLSVSDPSFVAFEHGNGFVFQSVDLIDFIGVLTCFKRLIKRAFSHAKQLAKP